MCDSVRQLVLVVIIEHIMCIIDGHLPVSILQYFQIFVNTVVGRYVLVFASCGL